LPTAGAIPAAGGDGGGGSGGGGGDGGGGDGGGTPEYECDGVGATKYADDIPPDGADAISYTSPGATGGAPGADARMDAEWCAATGATPVAGGVAGDTSA
jgi:hypothetical protein